MHKPVTHQPWPALAAVCAVIKFALIALGMLFALAGAATAARTTTRAPAHTAGAVQV